MARLLGTAKAVCLAVPVMCLLLVYKSRIRLQVILQRFSLAEQLTCPDMILECTLLTKVAVALLWFQQLLLKLLIRLQTSDC